MRLIIFMFFLSISFIVKANIDTLSYSSVVEIIDSTKAKGLVIRYSINKKSNTKDGFYTMSYKNNIMMKGSYSNDLRSGLWRFYKMGDTLQAEGNYKNGKKDGEWRSYYSNGKLSCNIYYADGNREKTTIGYYPDGQLSFQKNYANDTVIGEVKYYYPNGKTWYTEVYKKGERNGPSISYYENGQIKEDAIYIDEERDSIYKYYYENGTLWEHIVYRKGGIWNVIAYNDSTGKPINCCTIKDGNGTMRFYDKKGKITNEYEYKNLKKDGSTRYFRNGKLDKEGAIIQDHKEGIWKSYYESGELYSEIRYTNGNENGDAIYYSKDGKINNKSKFINGKSEGIWTSYDEKGKIKSEITYTKGRIDGECKYYEDGHLKSSGNCINGTKVGNWKFYNKKGKLDHDITLPEPNTSHYIGGDISLSKGVAEEKKSDTYTIVEFMPAFPGGINEMYKFITKNIFYPSSAKDNGIQGTVYVTFVVSSSGEIKDAKIIRGVQADIDEEALRIVNLMPVWSIGMQCGQPVSVQFNLPVKYTLR